MPIKAPWYREEDYPDNENNLTVVNGVGGSNNAKTMQKYTSVILCIHQTVLMIVLVLVMIPALVMFLDPDSNEFTSFKPENMTEL